MKTKRILQMKHISNIILAIFIFAVCSCTNDEQCRKNRYVRMQVGMYHVTNNGTTVTSTALAIDSITIKGIGVDSILYKNSKKIQSVVLPLNKLDSLQESSFQIKFNAITDTITIVHQNKTEYLSLECGCIKTHIIDTVLTTNHFIDSVRIPIHDVNTLTSAKENIKVYHN